VHRLNRGKHGSAGLLYIGIAMLAVLISYVFVQALHHTGPTAQPQAPLRDPR
jgi:hypothetical protein